MRLTAVSCLCLVLTGCSSYAPSGGSTAAQAPPPRANGLAPGSAATFYSVASNITGGAPCGTSSISQVLGFPTAESGVATPALTITSPNTVDRYGLVATDAAGNIYVFSSNTAQACGEVPGSAKILVFAPATSGTTTANPIRTITGPVAQLDGAGLMAVDGPGNIYLWESQGFGSTAPDTLVQFAAGANGNVAPVRTITLPLNYGQARTGAGYPAGLVVDGSGNILFATSNAPVNAINGSNGGEPTESDMIEVFTPGQSGAVAPARTISGPVSQLTQLIGIGVDGAGNIYVEMATYATGADPTILEFAGGATGTASAAPINRIGGAQTTLSRFVLDSLTVDAVGNIYVLDYTFPSTTGTDPYYILRFDVGATGNAVPVAAQLSAGVSSAATH